jgi:hypothetical protein
MTRLLAVAHQTAETDEFLDAVRSGATDGSEVVLLIPATPVKHLTSWTSGESRAIAREKADKVTPTPTRPSSTRWASTSTTRWSSPPSHLGSPGGWGRT